VALAAQGTTHSPGSQVAEGSADHRRSLQSDALWPLQIVEGLPSSQLKVRWMSKPLDVPLTSLPTGLPLASNQIVVDCSQARAANAVVLLE
jgi:hypothetical protein